ncbi:adenosylcobyric acid synthase [Kaistia hirudinis]|uniref:Cobyric acid synthase n=1 Tax=Kaistia hirudinis TaxID=1293440 RepID=A0A840AKF2_9HYPH|nr:cobyric acid synthase [Kaistia hirudinis]MBB3929411.1 adenosylcobyric acid synthase [Kaistia hirudinis]
MATPAIMFQGTGSNVGKSTLVAGLARLLYRRGLKVAPFKPQNMSNNAAVTIDGGEIGRAQALQARAAYMPPSVHMNPVLLKPESETGSQVIVQGRRFATMRAREYGSRKRELLPAVLESFAIISKDADIILVEGAGSPAEVNLRAGDIANMGFAEAADLPVVLIGDIDRGGVIASLVGTHTVLAELDRRRIKGFIINKMRGDPRLFDEALPLIQSATSWRPLGVVPHFADAARLPAEDTVGLASGPARQGGVRIAVPMLPRIANFDDLDPLRQEPGVEMVLVAAGEPIPVCDLILLPGSKSTIADLAFLRQQGWDIDIVAHRRRGGAIVGLCGGYQMLGRSIGDPGAIEGVAGRVPGLGLLDVDTILSADKRTQPFIGTEAASGLAVAGYEIHLGRSDGPDHARPWLVGSEGGEGAISPDGRVRGSYVHGVFASDAFRRPFLEGLGGEASDFAYEAAVEAALDGLADHLAAHLDIEAILRIAARG